jgi:DNA-binding protein
MAEETAEQQTTGEKDDHVVFVGNKPFMNYVTGVVMQFTTKNATEVIIKARGKFISRAVDIAEVATKRFLENTVEVKDIKIDSEEFENKEGKQVRVSTIEITLAKK